MSDSTDCGESAVKIPRLDDKQAVSLAGPEQVGSGDTPKVKDAVVDAETKSEETKCAAASMDGSPTESHSLAGFQVEKVLRENIERKSITVLGRYTAGTDAGGKAADGEDDGGSTAILVLEKSPLNVDSVKELCQSEGTCLKPLIVNGIYRTYQATAASDFNVLKLNMVCPATTSHIEKYSAQAFYIVEESPEDYSNVTLPWITESSFNIQWVYNILNKTSESESIIVEDDDEATGFVMVPDFKWNRDVVEDLYCLAICHTKDVKSLRDLTAAHLPLLRNIRDKGIAALTDKYGLKANQLRIYFHYQPSYYHLHVHFTNLRYEAPGTHALKAHLLSDVIDNIELVPDFYQRKTLAFCLKEGTTLYEKYREAGRV